MKKFPLNEAFDTTKIESTTVRTLRRNVDALFFSGSVLRAQNVTMFPHSPIIHNTTGIQTYVARAKSYEGTVQNRPHSTILSYKDTVLSSPQHSLSVSFCKSMNAVCPLSALITSHVLLTDPFTAAIFVMFVPLKSD